MSVEKSYNVTLKMITDDSGTFQSIRMLKSRSKLPESYLERINKALQQSLIPAEATRTTVAIGDDAEQKILNYLLSISSVNLDFNVADVSNKTGHGDIAVEYRGNLLCVEVKCYTKPVPMKEVEKYHRSLALAEYHGGILIQFSNHGFCREAGLATPIDLRIVDGKPSAYLTTTDTAMIYPIINMLIMHIDLDKPINEDELEIKRKALLTINEKLVDLRAAIDAQKKAIQRMESTVENIAALSIQ